MKMRAEGGSKSETDGGVDTCSVSNRGPARKVSLPHAGRGRFVRYRGGKARKGDGAGIKRKRWKYNVEDEKQRRKRA